MKIFSEQLIQKIVNKGFLVNNWQFWRVCLTKSYTEVRVQAE